MGWSLGLSPHLYKQRWVFINSTDMEDNIIKELTYSESYEESQTTHGFLVSLLTNWNSEGLWKHIQVFLSRLIVLQLYHLNKLSFMDSSFFILGSNNLILKCFCNNCVAKEVPKIAEHITVLLFNFITELQCTWN